MIDTEEQNLIIEYANEIISKKNKKENEIIGVNAFAGTGKSYILKRIVEENKDSNFIGIAFNNAIVKENSEKFDKRRCKWYTAHQLSKELITSLFPEKYNFKENRKNFEEIEIVDFLDIKKTNAYSIASDIKKIYSIFCNSSLRTLDEIEKIKYAAFIQGNQINYMNDNYIYEILKYIKKMWNLQLNSKINITYDFYLKFTQVYRLASNIKNIDLSLHDEAQDSNPVTVSILNDIVSPKIYVGDKHQSIYGFRGTIDALSLAKKSFYLSETFRYNSDISNIANSILSNYKKEEKEIISKVNNKLNNKAYIVRNNSLMITLIEDFIESKINFNTIKNPDDIFAASISLYEKRKNLEIKHKDYKFLENKNNFNNFDDVEAYINEIQSTELLTANKLQKRLGGKLYNLKNEAKNQNKSKSTIFFTTAHTSKGLEFGHVELMQDFPDINELMNTNGFKNALHLLDEAKIQNTIAKEIIQEINLLYVAVTRAIHSLDISKVKTFENMHFLKGESIY